MKIPRKKKKQIPKGMYCYEATSGWQEFPDGGYGFTVRVCPFYIRKKYKDIPENQRPNWLDDEFIEEHGDSTTGWCRLIKGGIDDQCKSCGERYGKLY